MTGRSAQYIILLFIGLCATFTGKAQDTTRFVWGKYTPNTTLRQAGNPSLPLVQMLVVLDESQPYIDIIEDSAWEEYSGFIAPAQPSRFKNQTPKEDIINTSLYAQDSYFSIPLWRLERLGCLMGKPVARLTLAPVEYSPVSNKIRIHNFRLLTRGIQPYQGATTDLPRNYWVVSTLDFQQELQSFVKWKKQMGYQVEEFYAESWEAATLKARLRDRYQASNGETPYILLVGDVDRIPTFSGRYCPAELDNHYTDHSYGEFTGDFLPDAIIGRLPAGSPEELQIIIRKSMAYEHGEYQDSSLREQVMIVAGSESRTPAPTTTNGHVNYLKHIFYDHGWDTLCFHNPDSDGQQDEILENLENNLNIVSFSGHCGRDGWHTPDITSNDIAPATPRLYINNCCLSNDFHSDCFGEQLLRKPESGAIGVIGATNETLWEEDFCWSVGAKNISLYPEEDTLRNGAFDRLLQNEKLSQGELLIAGNTAVSEAGSSYEKFYWEIYCLLGDPALIPWKNRPERLTLTVPDSLPAEATEINFSCTPGAAVTVLKENDLIGLQTADSTGQCTVRLTLPAGREPLIITASKAGYIPKTDTIRTYAGKPRLIVADIWLEDTSRQTISQMTGHEESVVAVTITSTGTAYRHQLTIHQSPEDSLEGNWVEFSPAPIVPDTIYPEVSDTLRFRLKVGQASASPLIKLHLDLSDTSETYCRLPLEIAYNPTEPYWENITFGNVQTFVRELAPQTSYTLSATLVLPPSDDSARASIRIYNLPDSVLLGSTDGFYGDTSSIAVDFCTTDSSRRISVSLEIHYENFHLQDSREYLIGQAVEGFETGDLTLYPWETSLINGWTIDTIAHTGRYSLRTGRIGNSRHSELALEIDVAANDTIGFWVKCSSQASYDRVAFSIDNEDKHYWSNIIGWKYWKTPISKGHHLLRWTYSKNSSGTAGEDCIWIDDIRWPFACWNTPYGFIDTTTPASVEIPLPECPAQELRISPNPASTMVTIQNLTGHPLQLTLFDENGRIVDYLLITSSQPLQYSTQHLRSGNYIIKTNQKAYKLIITQ